MLSTLVKTTVAMGDGLCQSHGVMELWRVPRARGSRPKVSGASLVQYVRKQKGPIRVKITALNYTVYVSPKEGAKEELGALDSETGAGPVLNCS